MAAQGTNKGGVVFVDPSHRKYQHVNKALAGAGVSVTWVRDTEAALFLVQTSRVALVMCDAATVNHNWRRFLASVRRVSPFTERLVLSVFSGSPDSLSELIDRREGWSDGVGTDVTRLASG
ncbi:MAG: hypothetical protein ACFHX7_24930 [Pseudomonadota bacterium]